MRVLITGGFGYLGGRLAQQLIVGAYAHVILGSRSESNPPAWLPQAEVVQTAWGDSASLDRACAGVDAVVHLAGMNAHDSANAPAAALQCNGVATAHLLASACRMNVRRFVYVSTAHVYANPLMGRITEANCPLNLHPYASSHRAGEDVVRSAHERGQIEGVVIRLSNAFGAPAHSNANCWSLLVNDLCRQAVVSRHMVLHSAGQQQRDFVPLADACCAVEHLLQVPSQALADGVFNVGGARPTRIVDMATSIQARCAATLHFTPRLVVSQPVEGGNDYELNYRIDKLLATGFVPAGNALAEIDATLLLCQDVWGVFN
ncbi:NAD(P)-dependent oxidoreductase [Polaromonas sp. AER18D-145]|uniref:NAD-dependent epimerase/dehydratase family protein n=1 Tax=Polaromonas sp. AER18D-145 TaxID=1977060 RepID=UPI000BBCBC7E|nr:SDR family oxidoreductase [Polaromonas sp. AER18D-145]